MCQIAFSKSSEKVKKLIKNTVVTAVSAVTVVRKITQTLQKKLCNLFSFLLLCQFLGKCNLTHLTTDVMFSGQRFAIPAMFLSENKLKFEMLSFFSRSKQQVETYCDRNSK